MYEVISTIIARNVLNVLDCVSHEKNLKSPSKSFTSPSFPSDKNEYEYAKFLAFSLAPFPEISDFPSLLDEWGGEEVIRGNKVISARGTHIRQRENA